MPEPEIPPEALEPSGRSEESQPKTAPQPDAGRTDGAAEIPPKAPDA